MESSRTCKRCRKRSVIHDETTGMAVCSSCGIEQEFNNFQAHFGGVNGPQGTFVRVGTSGSLNDYSYRERKIYQAQKQIEDIALKLGFSTATTAEVKQMVETLTEGEYGTGDWFPVVVGACSYVVVRRGNRSLPIAEIVSVIGCDEHELGRMIARVVEFLDLKLPEFDIVVAFERAIRTCPSFADISEEKLGKMVKQGRFILQCAVKWFLTTGRRPLPMIVAVLVFVAELNQIQVTIEDVSKEIHVAVITSRRRYKELKETLVEVARALPWGKDVTVKNILKNAPFVIQYMEMKSTFKPGEKRKRLEFDGFSLEDMVNGCLRKEAEYGSDNYIVENDSQYFEIEDRNGIWSQSDDLEKFKLSHECLSRIYSKISEEATSVKSIIESGEDQRRKRGRGFGFQGCGEWWTGKSDLSKRLSLDRILEKNVGFNALPPSFVNGSLACKRRREKIDAAKLRIKKIMQPQNGASGDKKDFCLFEGLQTREKHGESEINDIDWEDNIIEILLLHQVKEEEIEKGHYNTLLDLHLFNSGSGCKLLRGKKLKG